MKKILATFAITASFAGSAVAADLPVKARPMAPAPVIATNWTGCYIGAGGGYGMWNQDHRVHDDIATGGPSVFVVSQNGTAGGRGWFGTVQAGCDYQFSQRWVIGVFGDWDFGSLKGDFAPVGTLLVGEERLKNSWAVGGRVGYLVFPGLLGYVSGGYTQARFDGVNFNSAITGLPTGLSIGAQTYNGWFIGTGYEYALDFLPGLFWKTEYRYAQYDSKDNIVFLNGVATTDFIRAEKDVHKVRTELVWRFNFGGGPVMAKY